MKIDIEKFDPCRKGKRWYRKQVSSIQAWNDCHRGDWMIWMAKNLGVDEKKLVLTTAKCANTVRHLMKDERSRNAVDTAIAYAKGRATKEELRDIVIHAVEAYNDEPSNAHEVAFFTANSVFYPSASRLVLERIIKISSKPKQKKFETADICRDVLTEDIIKIIKKHERN